MHALEGALWSPYSWHLSVPIRFVWQQQLRSMRVGSSFNSSLFSVGGLQRAFAKLLLTDSSALLQSSLREPM